MGRSGPRRACPRSRRAIAGSSTSPFRSAGPNPPPYSFKGFAQLHALELDLGDLPAGAPVRLLMHGFTDYFTATSSLPRIRPR